ncbi:hypothetical protein HUJ04_011219 [Dendroctonus ponderosae]|nr:hypothetical protein HUJ04_011219 [Dendroctonus ponderosae]
MRLESMHKTIKYFYLNRKTVKRLDKGMHTSIGRVIKLVKGKNTICCCCHQNIFKRHQEARASKFVVQAISWRDVIIIVIITVIGVVQLKHFPFLRSSNRTGSTGGGGWCGWFRFEGCRAECHACNACVHIYMNVIQKIEKREDLMPQSSSKDSNNFFNLLRSQDEQENINDNLSNKVNQIFEKLQNCNLRELEDSTISEIHLHLNILSNLLRFSSTQKKKKRGNNMNEITNKKQNGSISNILSGKFI